MKSLIKSSGIILAVFFFSAVTQRSFGQARFVQTFIDPDTSANTYFGISVSGAGDLNNDGYDDIIIGASNYNSATGRAYVYYGGNPMDSTADLIMTGEGVSNFFGHSVSGAGDVNKDNYDDVIIGAYYYNSQVGRVYIYYGGTSMDTIADLTLTGPGPGYYFGYSVSGAGDVNKDSCDDVIIGAYRYNSYRGRAFIYYGGTSMDTIADIRMTGDTTGIYFGISVSGAGDVNNDGYDDVIVGAYGYELNRGRAYINYGGSSMDSIADKTLIGYVTGCYFGISVSGAGDVNNDNYDDVAVGGWAYDSYRGRADIFLGGNPMDSLRDKTMIGEATNNYFGRVSGAGDVNNDSYDDIIVGAHYYNSHTGRAYIYYGGSPIDSIADVIITGEGAGDDFGISVSGAGDINNDGYDEVIIGAIGYGLNGKAYIYSDPNSPVSVKTTVSLDPENFELLQNYPNPFNPSTTIKFQINNSPFFQKGDQGGFVTLKIYDILGREVATLVNEVKPAGSYKATWNAADLPSGIYFASLEFSGKQLTRKLLLIK